MVKGKGRGKSRGEAESTTEDPDICQECIRDDSLLAGEVIDLVKGPHKIHDGVDTVKWGDRKQRVRGIACSLMSTVAVIKKAKILGCDMVITHEPTFFNHVDEHFHGSPVCDAKRDFLRSCDPLIIWRWHDRCHYCSGMHPVYGQDEISDSFTRALKWEKYRWGAINSPDQNRFEFDKAWTLREIGRHW